LIYGFDSENEGEYPGKDGKCANCLLKVNPNAFSNGDDEIKLVSSDEVPEETFKEYMDIFS